MAMQVELTSWDDDRTVRTPELGGLAIWFNPAIRMHGASCLICASERVLD